MKNDSLEKISEIIKNNNSFLIISHKNPDGDTIGANFALAETLKLKRKSVLSYCEHYVPEDFRFLLNENISFTNEIAKIKDKKFDVLIAVDASDIRRFSEYGTLKNVSNIVINIDHHKTNEFFGDFNFVDLEASATAEIIYELIKILNYPITLNIAKSIYTGIITDTGSFRYSNTTAKSFKIASELMEYGINAWDISEKIYENIPYKRIKLLSEALKTLYLTSNDKIAIMCLDRKTLKKFNATYEDTDGFVNYGRSIRGVELSIFIREEENGCKLSFRSKGNVDASKLAEQFGGGGHFNAAGAFIEKSLKDALSIINKIIDDFNL